jgi:uncharacterized protein YjbI with pentapeptide repeats
MANKEHLGLLKQGVAVWNQWRTENSDIRPDLSGPDLSRADFRGADLSGIDLNGANLHGVNLMGADLSLADLRRTNLRGADLSGTELFKVDFFGADLSRASLIGARLIRANLIEADLTEANLSEADFSWADSIGVNLHRAHLVGAALIRANLIEADLTEANFSRASLNSANLSGADLSRANLRRGDLTGSNLYRASLSEADLRWTNLSRCIVGHTTFGDVDLSTVKGLDTVRHYGPSTIGIDTIYRAKGKIPQTFLRGAGAPDTFITHIASLTDETVQYYSCFISYASQDELLARQLYADLQQNGVRCWFAPEDMKIGEKIRLTIDQSIRMYDKLLLILSEFSMKSSWIEKEVKMVFEEEKKHQETVLLPIRLDAAVMDTDRSWGVDMRQTRTVYDFSSWQEDPDLYQKGIEQLLGDLRMKE